MSTPNTCSYFCARWKQYEAYVQALEGKYTDLNCKLRFYLPKDCELSPCRLLHTRDNCSTKANVALLEQFIHRKAVRSGTVLGVRK